MLSDEITTEVLIDHLISGRAGGVRGVAARLAPSGHDFPSLLRLQLSWRRDDPLAVVLQVSPEPDHPSLPSGRWTVLRDFLRYGLEVATGDGDVRLRPAGAAVHLELVGGCRTCELAVPITRIAAFLDATERVVPAGAERSEEALDTLIEHLLRR